LLAIPSLPSVIVVMENERKVNVPVVKRFVRKVVGCTCSDEVFKQVGVKAGSSAIKSCAADYEINVGGRLLIVLSSEPAEGFSPARLEKVMAEGRSARDAGKFNRFRFILQADNPPEAEKKLLRLYSQPASSTGSESAPVKKSVVNRVTRAPFRPDAAHIGALAVRAGERGRGEAWGRSGGKAQGRGGQSGAGLGQAPVAAVVAEQAVVADFGEAPGEQMEAQTADELDAGQSQDFGAAGIGVILVREGEGAGAEVAGVHW
jgi:hypothetical protein